MTTLVHFSSEYALSLLSALHDQLHTQTFCNVVLHVAGRQFHAHKNILAAASPYFMAMFTGGLSESQGADIYIHDISCDIFEKLLKFMYTGDIDITEETCQDLLTAADLFGLSGVVEASCLFLQQQLHPSNCLGIYQLAEAHHCMDLTKAAQDFTNAHFLEVSMGYEFLMLPKIMVKKLLSNEYVHIDNELQMLKALLRWIEHDLPGRRTMIFELLNEIRFPLISKIFLDEFMEDFQDLSLKIAVRKVSQDFDACRKSTKIDDLKRQQPHLFRMRTGARRKFMIIGGIQRDIGSKWNDLKTLCSVEVFDVHGCNHQKLPSLRYERSSHAAVAFNDGVYVLGGEKDSLIMDIVEFYDNALGKWSTAPSMTEPRCGLGAAEIGGCIYVLGGWIGAMIGHTVEQFNPEMNQWVVVDTMKSPRYHMGVVAHEGLIYVMGGIGTNECEEKTLQTYNPVTREWLFLADMPTARSDMGVCVADNIIYTVGGMNNDCGPQDSFESYDILKDQWTVISRLPVACAGPVAAYHNGLVYVFGGKVSDGGLYSALYTTDAVNCYNPINNTWSKGEPLSSGRCDFAVVAV